MLSSAYGYHVSPFMAELFIKYYLVSSSNGWLADAYIFNDIAITMGFKSCGQHINTSWLRELENSFYETVPCYKRPQIVMHFIQKLQGGNNNGTY